MCGSGVVIDLKLRGNPWGHNEVVQDSLEAKEFVATLTGHMAGLGFHFLTAVTLRLSGHFSNWRDCYIFSLRIFG